MEVLYGADALELMQLSGGVMNSGTHSDRLPPVLTSIAATPAVVNTDSAAAQITWTLHITDDLSGPTQVSYRISSPGQACGEDTFSQLLQQVSGTERNGSWQFNHEIPRYSAAGTYTICEMELADRVKNRVFYHAHDLAQLSPSFTNSGTRVDTDPPVLDSVRVAPDFVRTTDAAVTVGWTVHITDDLSGPCILWYELYGPDQACVGNKRFTPFHNISGTTRNGSWRFVHEVPRNSAAGRYGLCSLGIADGVGHSLVLEEADLAGYPVSFMIE